MTGSTEHWLESRRTRVPSPLIVLCPGWEDGPVSATTSRKASAVLPELGTVTQRLLDEGAVGVVLTGSHARQEAHDRSDIDFVAVGTGPSATRMEGSQLVSIAWAEPDEVRSSWRDPGKVGQAVPGWRHAVALADQPG